MDFEALLTPHLTDDDDRELWRTAVRDVYRDAEYLSRAKATKQAITTRLGACSRWRAPHRVRWSAAGGFAWPTGYDGPHHSAIGLPELDWHIDLLWDPEATRWLPAPDALPGKVRLTFDVAVPTRTERHAQAAVHTIWTPGWPLRPGQELVSFYGFRKQDADWELVATSDTRLQREAFERTAEALASRSEPRSAGDSGEGYELYACLFDGGASAVAAGLARGLSPDSTGPLGTPLLAVAVGAGDLEAARQLLAAGADLEGNGDSPLVHAVNAGQLSCVRLLVEAGADMHGTNREGYTAQQRLGHGMDEIAELLRKHSELDGAALAD